MSRSTYPLFPTDDGWPYPDSPADEASAPTDDGELDLDALELQVDPRPFSELSPVECDALTRRYGFDCDPESMKEVARSLGCSHAQARDHLGRALDKIRARLAVVDP
jgi:DNA-directed RNA polymerase sigma subunit (sigma70/sigma32)